MRTSLLFLLVSTLGTSYTAASGPVRRSVTALSATELASFAPFTQFARAAYCGSDALKDWSCGEACDAVSDFEPTLVGGNGNDVQYFFVGYWPSEDAIVVGHEGTDPTQFESVLTDIDALQDNLDADLFPGVSSDVYVHGGFRDAQAETASEILAEVQSLIASKGTSNLIFVGHSLGGALAELDGLFFALNIPSATIKVRTYGTPRVGNAAFAELIDSKTPDFKRINNKHDLIPILPGRGLGYSHPEGEIHILAPGSAVACPGNDDATDSQCQIETVPNIFAGNIIDHLGPYEGIYIGTIFCY
ncbi:Alpha/Beta hydrolase protein [Desarmillaria tabescens]|uniref:Alpha/Beta hydrolase protein n=1 Tax=Armillaria tabescens TaxID=1929756 RepID=A0AA39N8W4_ARMTA|nr:Alpha/Beta hydrolase protein [Desarmillaria tabescens]KAK0461200.1 Alpha/Beta hydrolase protein [Desarmillaria tabescens]